MNNFVDSIRAFKAKGGPSWLTQPATERMRQTCDCPPRDVVLPPGTVCCDERTALDFHMSNDEVCVRTLRAQGLDFKANPNLPTTVLLPPGAATYAIGAAQTVDAEGEADVIQESGRISTEGGRIDLVLTSGSPTMFRVFGIELEYSANALAFEAGLGTLTIQGRSYELGRSYTLIADFLTLSSTGRVRLIFPKLAGTKWRMIQLAAGANTYAAVAEGGSVTTDLPVSRTSTVAVGVSGPVGTYTARAITSYLEAVTP